MATSTPGPSTLQSPQPRQPPVLHLNPPPLRSGGLEAFKKLGRTWSCRLSPGGNEVVCFVARKDSGVVGAGSGSGKDGKSKFFDQERTVHFATYDEWPASRRSFITDTYTVFSSLQKIARDYEGDRMDEAGDLHDDGRSVGRRRGGPIECFIMIHDKSIPEPNQIAYYGRCAKLYRDAILRYMRTLENQDEVDLTELTHFSTIHAIMQLAELVYFPLDGLGDGVVGEQILDWVNRVDRAPSTEEGTELVNMTNAYESPNFWPYIWRCVIRGLISNACAVLRFLTQHPNRTLSFLSANYINLLSSIPRSSSFKLESEFLQSFRKWQSEVQKQLTRLEWDMNQFESDRGTEEEKEDERDEWEARFRILLKLMVGDVERILDFCEDWREAVGAWGLLVNPGMKRDDFPDVMRIILSTQEVDENSIPDKVQSALLEGDTAKAMKYANELDSWLVAHLTDLLDKIGLMEDDPAFELDLRTFFLLRYTDMLQSDPSLWRVLVDYLAECGSVGRSRMKIIVRRVILEFEEADSDPTDRSKTGEQAGEGARQGEQDTAIGGTEGRDDKDKDKIKGRKANVEDLLRICEEHEMEAEARSICKVASEQLVRKRRYGDAISFCVKSGDAKRIARIADKILDEYLDRGEEEFAALVDRIPKAILHPSTNLLSTSLEHARTNKGQTPFGFLQSPHSVMSPHPLPGPVTPVYAPRLSFLARYRDFHALYARGDTAGAAKLIVLLLTSKIAPKKFWAVLLVDVVALVEDERMLFSAQDTYELLRALEEITAPIAALGGRDADGNLACIERLFNAQLAPLPDKQNSGSGQQAGQSRQQPRAAGDKDEVERIRKQRTLGALKQMDVVRQALARYLARLCTFPRA